MEYSDKESMPHWDSISKAFNSFHVAAVQYSCVSSYTEIVVLHI